MTLSEQIRARPNDVDSFPTEHMLDEAADTIDALVAALEKARNQLEHLNRCHKHLSSTDDLLPTIDAALALARGIKVDA